MPLARPFRLAAALVAALALPAPAQDAFDPANMTEAEREAFRAEVRAYLMENPEVLMEAIGVLEQRQAAEQAEADADLVAEHADDIFETERSWSGGNPEGDITLVEFIDYRCGYCRRAFPEVQDLVRSDGNIRLIVKEFPILGEQSVLASRFAIATRMVEGDAAYKRLHDELIAMRGEMNELSLELVGDQLGLDVEAITARMDDETVTEVIESNHALAQRLRIQGTPTYVLGDRLVRGYVPLEEMRSMVSEERAEG
jgi:protein-disulfide isomerase